MPKKASIAAQMELPARKHGGFQAEYDRLNDGQRLAVDTIEGPVMVVAGPGTGKTQTVSMRVANILRKTQMRPSNILCLTYSVSGATAMRERMRRLIGADAYGVTVSTVHAFAQSIIDDNPDIFDDWGVKKQLTDIDRYRELNAIIDTVSGSSALINPKDPYSKDTDLLGRISQVKREGKTYDDLLAAADRYDAEMAAKSREGTKAHADNLLKARKFRDFIELFRLYQEMLARTGRYDYDDMILQVLRALREHDWVLAGLQERYQYILVDEVQDLNGAQFELITLLTTYAELKHEPNLFIVGDDDQSIYRFQGANLQYMLAFRDRFPNAVVVPLTVSYRSTQEILDAATVLIEKNADRLTQKIPSLQKRLASAAKDPGETPVLLRPPSDTAEPWAIAELIEDRLAAGAQPEEIAILVRKNAELFPIYDVLRSKGIPVLLRGKSDLLTHPLVANLLAILQYLDKPHLDQALSAALAVPSFGIHSADLARVQSAARERKQKLGDVLLSVEDGALSIGGVPTIVAARDTLFGLQQRAPLRTVPETVEAVIRECNLLPHSDELLDKADPRDTAAIEAFFEFAKRRVLEEPSYVFKDFLSDLHFYGDPTYGQVRLTYELPHLTTTGVWLMTAHQSKGLEFKHVILSNFKDGHWDDPQKRTSVSIPEDILFGWIKEQKSSERSEDERRLAFVAATRAERELVMFCAKESTVGEKTRAISPSAFFAEMGALPERDVGLRAPEAASLLLRPAPVLDDAMRSYLIERLESFALSATSLDRFLRDPIEFLRVDLLNQPEFLDEASLRRLGYGSAAHWALKEWATALQRGEPFPLEEFLKQFRWYLDERTILNAQQRADLLSMGTDSLARYYERCLKGRMPHFHAIERDYRARLGDIPLKGKIDRIDLSSPTSANATIIDYKTGATKTEGVIRGGLEPGEVSRTKDGANFRQLTFYAILLEKADPLLKPEAFILEFLGERSDAGGSRSFVVSAAEKASLVDIIEAVWQKIGALDFTPLENSNT